MNELDEGYSAEICLFNKVVWDELLSRFKDANLYQAWSYDMVRFRRNRVVHMVMRKMNKVVAAAQIRIVRLPFTGNGIAYVRWGPIWRLNGVPEDMNIFRQVVRALRNELSIQRGLVLRLYPLAYRKKNENLGQILLEEGYKIYEDGRAEHTLICDLAPSLEELRANLNQKWRNCLNRAEKNSLELVMGEEDQLIENFIKIYSEMLNRKGLLEPPSDVNYLREVQKDLSSDLKLKVILCYQTGKLCAGAIFSAIGKTGVYLAGATSDTGLKTNSSYLVQWTFVKWLKENGFLEYDLNGINPYTNPGTYHFKRGLAGKCGRDVEFLGKYQVVDSLLSAWVVKIGENLVSIYRRMIQGGRSLHNLMNKDS